MSKPKLTKLDYLEIIDISTKELMSYTKQDLIDLTYQLANELHDMEYNNNNK